MGSHRALIPYRKEDGKVKGKCPGQNGGEMLIKVVESDFDFEDLG